VREGEQPGGRGPAGEHRPGPGEDEVVIPAELGEAPRQRRAGDAAQRDLVGRRDEESAGELVDVQAGGHAGHQDGGRPAVAGGPDQPA
jgi:hypothetical protein